MKILGISGSPRAEQISTTYKTVKTVLDATGLEYELLTLRGKVLHGCISCLGCVEDNVCVVHDYLHQIRDKIIEADALVIGAPNYYSGMNANMHALMERFYQFRHRECNALWGKLAVLVGVGGANGDPVVDQMENFMAYNFIETVEKVSGQGAACCFSCGYGETCKVGAIHMFFGPGTKITDEMVPSFEKQPQLIEAAKKAGQCLAQKLEKHDRDATTAKMQKLMMDKFKVTT